NQPKVPQSESELAHTQCPLRPFIGANRTTSLRPHDSINGAIVVTRCSQPALQLRNGRSIGVAVIVSGVAVVVITVPIRTIIPIRIIARSEERRVGKECR